MGDQSRRAPALSVEHLSKHFGDRVAFDDVSFEVSQGEVFGFLVRRRRQDDDCADIGHTDSADERLGNGGWVPALFRKRRGDTQADRE